jgi:serine/threonine protein kinase
MAPEVYKGDPYTEKVDVYSAGVILFEMLSGRLPFEGDTRADLFRAKDVGIKEKKLLAVSESLREVLKRMLHPDPEQRLSMDGVF